MTLDAAELAAVIAEARPVLAVARLRSVHQYEPAVFVLTFRNERESRFLSISIEPGTARLHLVDVRDAAPATPPEFCVRLRRWLDGRALIAIDTVDEDRIARLAFSGRKEPVADRGVTLIAELLPRTPNLVVLDAGDRVLGAMRPIVRRGIEVKAGELWSPPRRPDVERGVAVEIARDDAAEFPISAALARRYRDAPAPGLSEVEIERFRRRVERELKRREKVLESIDADLSRTSDRERHREIGEILKASLGRLRRGQSSIELTDYFSPELGTVVIPLDPALTPLDNVEKRFKAYRKACRALPILTKRRELIATERDEIRAISSALAVADSLDRAGLDELERRLRVFEKQARGKRPAAPSNAASGPRRFISSEGLEILVGRSAQENDDLTLRIAHGNDIFLHVAGRPGAHVILRCGRGGDVPHGALVEAAMLALYYSFAKRSLGSLIGARGEVDYTRAKFVKKPRGAKPGAVLLASHKSIRVEIDESAFTALRQRSGSVD